MAISGSKLVFLRVKRSRISIGPQVLMVIVGWKKSIYNFLVLFIFTTFQFYLSERIQAPYVAAKHSSGYHNLCSAAPTQNQFICIHWIIPVIAAFPPPRSTSVFWINIYRWLPLGRLNKGQSFTNYDYRVVSIILFWG